MAKDITLLLLLDINWKFVYGIRGFDMCRGKWMMIPYNSYFFLLFLLCVFTSLNVLPSQNFCTTLSAVISKIA